MSVVSGDLLKLRKASTWSNCTDSSTEILLTHLHTVIIKLNLRE